MSLPVFEVELVLPRSDFAVELEMCSSASRIGLEGPSGSGKTSILKCLAGMLRPKTGMIRFRGETWFDSTAKIWTAPNHRKVGYVPQTPMLFPHFSVGENLNFGKTALQPGHKQFRQIIEALEIGSLLDRFPQSLSGGEAQRVSLGRALLNQPKLLLLDEPNASLDAPLRTRLRGQLVTLIEELGLPLWIASHDRGDLSSLATEHYTIERGRLRSTEPTALPDHPDPPESDAG
ncbi:MAG: ATP-binding cassette domain-containing protein [Verrucomicrobiota bacterium]